jgi:hypothetical protein
VICSITNKLKILTQILFVAMPTRNMTTIMSSHESLFNEYLTQTAGTMLAYPDCAGQRVNFTLLPIQQQEPAHGWDAGPLASGEVDFLITYHAFTNCYVIQ